MGATHHALAAPVETIEGPPATSALPLLPRTRGDCVDGPRPCPHLQCRYHLAVDGAVGETCALDVAGRAQESGDDATLAALGKMYGVSRERVRQRIAEAARKLQGRLAEFRDYERVEVSSTLLDAAPLDSTKGTTSDGERARDRYREEFRRLAKSVWDLSRPETEARLAVAQDRVYESYWRGDVFIPHPHPDLAHPHPDETTANKDTKERPMPSHTNETMEQRCDRIYAIVVEHGPISPRDITAKSGLTQAEAQYATQRLWDARRIVHNGVASSGRRYSAARERSSLAPGATVPAALPVAPAPVAAKDAAPAPAAPADPYVLRAFGAEVACPTAAAAAALLAELGRVNAR